MPTRVFSILTVKMNLRRIPFVPGIFQVNSWYGIRTLTTN